MNNLLLGFLGPLLFKVDIVNGMLLGTFECVLGALGIAYIWTFAPLSGNQTLVYIQVAVLKSIP
jgi:hypothetical protein